VVELTDQYNSKAKDKMIKLIGWTGLFKKRDEIMGDWRKLHNEELHNFYSSPSTIRMIKTRTMSWAGNVARIGEGWNAYRIFGRKTRRKQTTRKTNMQVGG
jgi:hypothetical protein